MALLLDISRGGWSLTDPGRSVSKTEIAGYARRLSPRRGTADQAACPHRRAQWRGHRRVRRRPLMAANALEFYAASAAILPVFYLTLAVEQRSSGFFFR